MHNELAGKRILITGGTRGIGKAAVLACARAGATVVTCHRTPGPAAEALAKELAGIGAPGTLVVADITDAAAVERVMDTCLTTLGGLDVLVNNVGVDGMAPLSQLTPEMWQDMLDRNLTSVYRVTRAALPLLGSGGSIITVGSAAALRGRPAAAHYAASKAALLGFTRGLARELGPRGIRVNSVEPGLVDSPDAEHSAPPFVVQKVVEATPLGRLCTPEDVAGVIEFLASPRSDFVTGEAIKVDGGM
ncbi:SDR family NAD(P)-dependent oxidoreductase [Nocardia acidivorans]|uniref:SDR family NAD(P)-dependent oxidoreductase n=1 Tax=Nocardia acidivorans TaxID=404580 RepID=UPI0008330304|nr:SDR family oxidoreductase [Nocardia acidivorans]